jgi:hypothetical protein
MVASLAVCRTGASTVNENLTRYTSIAGHLAFGTTESIVEIPVRDAGNFTSLSAYASANTLNSSSVLTLRKSGVDTALLLTFAATQIGSLIATTSVSFAATDEVSLELVTPVDATGGSQGITFRVVGTAFEPTSTGNCVSFMAARGAAATTLNSTTSYMIPSGYMDTLNTSEAERKLRIRTAGTARDFCVNISANARTSSTTFRTRKNGSNGSQSVTFTTTQIGVLEAAGSDTLADGDDFNYSVTTGSGSGESISIAMMSTSFVTTNGVFTLVASQNSGAVSIAAATTVYLAAGGRLFAETTEDQAEILTHFPFTVQTMTGYFTAHSLDGLASITARDNGADSNLNILLVTGSGIPGLKDEVTHFSTAHIEAGETLATSFDTSGSSSGTIALTWLALTCSPVVRTTGGSSYGAAGASASASSVATSQGASSGSAESRSSASAFALSAGVASAASTDGAQAGADASSGGAADASSSTRSEAGATAETGGDSSGQDACLGAGGSECPSTGSAGSGSQALASASADGWAQAFAAGVAEMRAAIEAIAETIGSSASSSSLLLTSDIPVTVYETGGHAGGTSEALAAASSLAETIATEEGLAVALAIAHSVADARGLSAGEARALVSIVELAASTAGAARGEALARAIAEAVATSGGSTYGSADAWIADEVDASTGTFIVRSTRTMRRGVSATHEARRGISVTKNAHRRVSTSRGRLNP